MPDKSCSIKLQRCETFFVAINCRLYSAIHPKAVLLYIIMQCPLHLNTGVVALQFKFKKKKLEALYTEEKGVQKYEAAVVDAFFEVMAIIDAAMNMKELYALKGLRLELLSGKRKHQRSFRLNDQWRLIYEIAEEEQGQYLLIIDIEDYH